MNKTILVVIITIVILIGGYFLYQSNYSNYSPTTNNPDPSLNNETTVVVIKNFSFAPVQLNIKAGTTVKWINEDSAPHEVNSETFNSETLNTGDSFEFKFTQNGTYDYFCSLHPSMNGKIIVN